MLSSFAAALERRLRKEIRAELVEQLARGNRPRDPHAEILQAAKRPGGVSWRELRAAVPHATQAELRRLVRSGQLRKRGKAAGVRYHAA